MWALCSQLSDRQAGGVGPKMGTHISRVFSRGLGGGALGYGLPLLDPHSAFSLEDYDEKADTVNTKSAEIKSEQEEINTRLPKLQPVQLPVAPNKWSTFSIRLESTLLAVPGVTLSMRTEPPLTQCHF